MATNIEIKARVSHLGTIRTKAASLASATPEFIAQTDTFFVVPRGRLKVREFADGSGELISYDRADERGPRQSSYTRCACNDALLLVRTLGRVLTVRGRVIKRRELFMVGRTRVHLDDVEGLGTFVELEVVLSDGEPVEQGDRQARDLLRVFEIPESDLIAGAYIDLLEIDGRSEDRPLPIQAVARPGEHHGS